MPQTPNCPPVIVLTGATSGIGLASARRLLGTGVRLVAVGPNEPSMREAAASLADIGVPLEGQYSADFRDLDAVRALADELLVRHPQIDVLINNAGVLMDHRETTPQGHETTWTVNYLAPALLSARLLPALAAQGGSIVNLSSSSHTVGRLRFEDLSRERGYSPLAAYAQSKLAVATLTREWGRRLSESGRVRCNCIHPGVAATALGQNRGFIGRLMHAAKGMIRNPDDISGNLCALALGDVGGDVTGGYFDGQKHSAPAKRAQDAAAAARLVEVTEHQIGQPLPCE